MDFQSIAVSVIVAVCAFMALWQLAPAALRRGTAQRLARLPWPAPIATRLARLATRGGACGCDGCDGPPAGKAPDVSVIRIQRRPPQR